MKYSLSLFAASMLSSCASLTNIKESELTPDYYEYRKPAVVGVTQKAPLMKVYVDVKNDTLRIIPVDKPNGAIASTKSQIFLKRAFDVDVLIVPFKYRPTILGFPSQLTTDFNGNIFLGYRIDRYQTKEYDTPAGAKRWLKHGAVTVGCFGGFGTSFISAWTTNYQTTDEYSGFILSRGFSAMVGVKTLTLGVGVGWDYLVDRDKDIWNYHNKPWFGLMLSLNLN